MSYVFAKWMNLPTHTQNTTKGGICFFEAARGEACGRLVSLSRATRYSPVPQKNSIYLSEPETPFLSPRSVPRSQKSNEPRGFFSIHILVIRGQKVKTCPRTESRGLQDLLGAAGRMDFVCMKPIPEELEAAKE